MADRNSQFVVTELRPETSAGGRAGSYQLTANSVSPTRVVGVDDVGMPIEETIPACYSRWFVGLDGCEKDIPMRTAAVFSMETEAERYEHQVMREIIRAGQMPLEACPYTFEYKHIKGTSLVKVPAGASDCGGSNGRTDSFGKPVPCEHMLAVMTERKRQALIRHEKIQRSAQIMKPEDVQRMHDQMADSIGAAIARHTDPKAAKARLRAGVGEGE